MTVVGTTELNARHGLSSNAIHRLIARGIIRPAGAGGSGSAWAYDEAEQRAVAAVVQLMRSHLMEEGKSPKTAAHRDLSLRAVAEAARAPLPEGGRVRWLILLADGSCVRGDDSDVCKMPTHRTCIPIMDLE